MRTSEERAARARARRRPALAAAGRWLALVVGVLAIALAGRSEAVGQAEGSHAAGSLAGRLLVATPAMPDARFAKSVILMVEHDASGAFGLMVNRPMGRMPLATFLEGLEIEAEDVAGEVAVHYGGPVELNRGFLVHSLDYVDEETTVVAPGIGLTVDVAVMEAIGRGRGPRRWLFAFGYAGWSAGQLEREIAAGHWIDVAADAALVFAEDGETTWRRALARERIDL